jgi:hypothetical protein
MTSFEKHLFGILLPSTKDCWLLLLSPTELGPLMLFNINVRSTYSLRFLFRGRPGRRTEWKKKKSPWWCTVGVFRLCPWVIAASEKKQRGAGDCWLLLLSPMEPGPLMLFNINVRSTYSLRFLFRGRPGRRTECKKRSRLGHVLLVFSVFAPE